MFTGLQASNASFLGMYELQFWLGLKALTEQGNGPDAVDNTVAERFLAALEISTPPTPAALLTKTSLLTWLQSRRDDGWRLRTSKWV